MANFLTGSPERFEQLSNVTPQQMSASSQALNSALQYLQPNQQFDFAPIEAQARKNYSEKTLPSIYERFTASGTQRGSSFANALKGSASDLESNLAAMKSNIGLQQQDLNNRRMMSLFDLGMRPQFDTLHYGAQPGLFGGLSQGLGYGLGQLPQLYYLSKLLGNNSAMGGGLTQQPSDKSRLLATLSHILQGGAAGSSLGPIGAAGGAGLGAILSLLGGK